MGSISKGGGIKKEIILKLVEAISGPLIAVNTTVIIFKVEKK